MMTDVEIARIDERSKRNEGRIKVLERRQDDLDKLVSSIAMIQQDIQYIRQDVDETKADVKAMTAKPGQRWDDLIKIIITALVSGGVGYFLSKMIGG